MESRWCTACGKPFQPCPTTPRQSYCADEACQRERRRLWQQAKRKSDPDYMDNQAKAQKNWCERNSDYWRQYRDTHPDYVARNRDRQRTRNTKNPKKSPVAKIDARRNPSFPADGLYRIQLLDKDGVAKSDALIVRITLEEVPQ